MLPDNTMHPQTQMSLPPGLTQEHVIRIIQERNTLKKENRELRKQLRSAKAVAGRQSELREYWKQLCKAEQTRNTKLINEHAKCPKEPATPTPQHPGHGRLLAATREINQYNRRNREST